MAVSMANKLDEVWISTQPALLMVYVKQYLPDLFRWYVLLNVTNLISCFCDDKVVFNWVSKVIKKLESEIESEITNTYITFYYGFRLFDTEV